MSASASPVDDDSTSVSTSAAFSNVNDSSASDISESSSSASDDQSTDTSIVVFDPSPSSSPSTSPADNGTDSNNGTSPEPDLDEEAERVSSRDAALDTSAHTEAGGLFEYLGPVLSVVFTFGWIAILVTVAVVGVWYFVQYERGRRDELHKFYADKYARKKMKHQLERGDGLDDILFAYENPNRRLDPLEEMLNENITPAKQKELDVLE